MCPQCFNYYSKGFPSHTSKRLSKAIFQTNHYYLPYDVNLPNNSIFPTSSHTCSVSKLDSFLAPPGDAQGLILSSSLCNYSRQCSKLKLWIKPELADCGATVLLTVLSFQHPSNWMETPETSIFSAKKSLHQLCLFPFTQLLIPRSSPRSLTFSIS